MVVAEAKHHDVGSGNGVGLMGISDLVNSRWR